MPTPLNRFLCSQLIFLSLLSPQLAAQDIEEENEVKRNENSADKKPAEAPEAIDIEKQQLLGLELKDDALVWLEAVKGNKFIAMWEPDTSGNPLGAVLMLHGEGQTPDWPNSLRPLRENLPGFGWATLSLNLPNPLQSHTTVRKSQPPESDNKENNDDEKQIVASRIQAGMEFLNQNGQYNIVLLGQGLGAIRGAAFIRAKPNQNSGKPLTGKKSKAIIQRSIRAFIMINARNLDSDNETDLSDLLRDRSLPVLDVYSGDHFLDESESASRLIAAKKHRLLYYQQYKILEPSTFNNSASSLDENRMTRRVRGFLNKYAKGVEIEGGR